MTEDFHSTFYSAHSFTIVLYLLLSLYLSLSAAHQLRGTSDGEAIFDPSKMMLIPNIEALMISSMTEQTKQTN